MPRPQFNIRTLLVATLIVAAFFGGMVVQRIIDLPAIHQIELRAHVDGSPMKRVETMVMKDGTVWRKDVPE